jgi:hypothetical protein
LGVYTVGPQGLGLTKRKRRQRKALPAFTNVVLSLKREGHTCPRHTEVVVGTVEDVPAEIADNPDVGRDTNFEAAAELPKKATLIFRSGESDSPLLIK